MSDRRPPPARARVATPHSAETPTGAGGGRGATRRIAFPVVDLLREPGGARDRQLLFGEAVTVLEARGDWAFVQAARDGYVGHLRGEALAPARTATHWVAAPATHVYGEPDMKSPERMALSFGSRLTVSGERDGFAETPEGFVPRVHLRAAGDRLSDPVAVAELFLGTPYLWGGNSRWGIDCSGLVQTAMLACGIPCPGDSDRQAAELGAPLPPGTPPRRGDLLFWKGHVALVVDAARLIHANAHHMAVVQEPLRAAIDRIAARGGGPVTAHRRPG